MSQATFYIGDTRDVTATLADGSVDLVMTSPPFLALRSYLPDDHPDKHREIGSEANPAAFIDVMLELTAEWGRVLAPHGSICIELGDTYSGVNLPGPGSGDNVGNGRYSHGRDRPTAHRRVSTGWPLAKSLALIPELYRIALAYGINPLTGQESPAGRWRVRNVVRWHRPNPPVGALGDKYRPATTDMVIACKSAKRWFDLDAVRTAFKYGEDGGGSGHTDDGTGNHGGTRRLAERKMTHAGAPPLDTWIIPTAPFKGAHYATYPPELCRIPIQSMCPRAVCVECGEPRRRVVGDAEYVSTTGGRVVNHFKGKQRAEGANAWEVEGGNPGHVVKQTPTLGWTVCDCADPTYRNGLVLDPFVGSGTTLAVATGHNRDAIGIDIDHRNADHARQRVGMFLTVEDTRAEAAS